MLIKITNILILFVIICGEVSAYSDSIPLQQEDTPLYLKNPIYKRRIEMFKLSKIKKADIVMLGNSLTDGGNWSELLGRKGVVNRGIIGDILEGYLNRMQYVYNLHPKVCFIEGGINDIYNWLPVKKIFEKYVRVLKLLKKHGITPVIQSTLYTSPKWGEDWIASHNPGLKPAEINKERNREVDKLNALLKEYARQNKIIYVNINKLMSSHGFLRSSLTWDGAHLRARGYKIWAREIDKILIKLGL